MPLSLHRFLIITPLLLGLSVTAFAATPVDGSNTSGVVNDATVIRICAPSVAADRHNERPTSPLTIR